MVKCHECGRWFKGLGQHIKSHNLKRKEYNIRHGLRTSRALSAMSVRQKHRECAAAQDVPLQRRRPPQRTKRAGEGERKASRSVETQNEQARCAAQLLFRVQMLAARLKRTPAGSDLEKDGIPVSALRLRFGSVGAAMDLCGLAANETGMPPNPLPRNFPEAPAIKKAFSERMPWPEDYSKIDPFKRRRV